MKKKTSAKSPWPVAPHELEGEAEEDGGGGGAAAAVVARGTGSGLRGTCVLFGAALPMYI